MYTLNLKLKKKTLKGYTKSQDTMAQALIYFKM